MDGTDRPLTRSNMIQVIYDLETNGFNGMPLFSKFHRILQICALRLDTKRVFSSFVNPLMEEIPAKSTAIHNITLKDVYAVPPIEKVFKLLLQELEICEDDKVEFIAHNNSRFDEIILKKEVKVSTNFTFWDSLPFLKQNFNLRSYTLESVHKHFYHCGFKNAHRADADVFALAKIYQDHLLPIRSTKPLTVCKIKQNCLTDIYMIGAYRARLIIENIHLDTVQKLKTYFKCQVNIEPKALDTFLQTKIKIQDVTQRMFVISQVLDIYPYDESLKEFMNVEKDSDVLNHADFYIKYRYGLAKRPTSEDEMKYQKGLFEIKNKQ